MSWLVSEANVWVKSEWVWVRWCWSGVRYHDVWWVSEYLKWANEWMSELRVREWISEWVDGWVSEWVDGWVSEWCQWLGEWSSEWRNGYPDSMTMLGQRWPMVVHACWRPNIIKKALAQRNFAHRPYVGPRSKMNALVQRWHCVSVLAQCKVARRHLRWPNITKPTPTIGQPTNHKPTLGQRMHAICGLVCGLAGWWMSECVSE